MVFGPVATLAIAGAAAAGATAYEGVRKQNAAIEASQRAQGEAAGLQQQQLTEAAALERNKRINEANMIRSRLRVSAGERGVGMAGSTAAFMRQLDYAASMNMAIINRNLANQNRAVMSGAQANIAALTAGLGNRLLSAFSGALGGASTGLQIGGAFPSEAPGAVTGSMTNPISDLPAWRNVK